MLKLVFDVKCGFESIYLVEKGLEFPLDFLTNKTLFDLNNYNSEIEYLDENTLYLQYALNPNKFILDYKLFDVLRVVVAQEYFEACFKNFRRDGKIFFPELFTIENVHMEKIAETGRSKSVFGSQADDPDDSVERQKETSKFDA